FFFQAEDGIRDLTVTGVQTCALPIFGVVRDAIEAARVEREAPIPSGGPDPYRFADESEFLALLRDAGFTEVSVEKIDLTHRVAEIGRASCREKGWMKVRGRGVKQNRE